MKGIQAVKFVFLVVLLLPMFLLLVTVTGGSRLPILDVTDNQFVSKWNTTLTSPRSSTSKQINLPLEPSGTYNFTVNWGDNTSNIITRWDQVEVTHTYAVEGIYTLTIDGTLTGWRFNNSGDKLKIIEISQWGNIHLGNSHSYFYGSLNLKLIATDALNLTGTTSLFRAFALCLNLGNSGDMNSWDVSNVRDMGKMFQAAVLFNQQIDRWNVSGVENMGHMFNSALSFNQPIHTWNVSNVLNMGFMFRDASSFNQPIGEWNVSKVMYMEFMFEEATSFNRPLEDWDVSSVLGMGNMFESAIAFNQPIDTWNVSGVENMGFMFRSASSFNQPIGDWDISSVIGIGSMFEGAISFNQPLGNWDVSNIKYMDKLFHNTTLSTTNYDNLLTGWARLPLQSYVLFDAGNSRFSNITAKQYIIDSFSWTIIDGGYIDITPPKINSPDDFGYELGSTGNIIVWNVEDVNPDLYNVTMDGSLYLADTLWNRDTITVNVDGLEIGNHVFILYIYDSYGNGGSDTVVVNVIGAFESTSSVYTTTSVGSSNESDQSTRSTSFTNPANPILFFFVSLLYVTSMRGLRKKL